jgi:hypothetical protein
MQSPVFYKNLDFQLLDPGTPALVISVSFITSSKGPHHKAVSQFIFAELFLLDRYQKLKSITFLSKLLFKF